MGDLELPNRVVMCALTRRRCRASGMSGGVPNELHVEYYSRRAEAAFILTECTWVSPEGDSFPRSTGIVTQD